MYFELCPFNLIFYIFGTFCGITLFNFLFYFGVLLVNKVVLVSNVQQSDSVIHTHISIFFSNSSPIKVVT